MVAKLSEWFFEYGVFYGRVPTITTKFFLNTIRRRDDGGVWKVREQIVRVDWAEFQIIWSREALETWIFNDLGIS